MMNKKGSFIGSIAFIVAVVLAIILGVIDQVSTTVSTILVILGLIVGVLNVQKGESRDFLLAGAVFVLMIFLGREEINVVPAVNSIFRTLLLVFVPATAVVALKKMLKIARK